AAAWLARGEHVILDAAFLGRRERELARRVAVEPGGTFRVVECRCPDALMRERLAERDESGTDASDAGVAVYEAQLGRFQPLAPDLPGVVRVETTAPPWQLARQVLAGWWGAREG